MKFTPPDYHRLSAPTRSNSRPQPSHVGEREEQGSGQARKRLCRAASAAKCSYISLYRDLQKASRTISTLLQICQAGLFLPYNNRSRWWDKDLVLARGRQSKPNIHGRHRQCLKRAALLAPWLHPPASCPTHRTLAVGTVVCCSGGFVLNQLLWFLR